MTKFNVGEMVRIKRLVSEDCMSSARIGDLAEIISGFDGQHYPVNYNGATCGYITPGSIEPYKPRKHNARLSEAEVKIAALEAEVAAMKKAQEPTEILINGKTFTEATGLFVRIPRGHSKSRFMESMISPEPASPNQRRADVIKRAQAFVADLTRRARDRNDQYGGNEAFRRYLITPEFHVNAEKRTVVALAKVFSSNEVRSKGIAKCAPDDVFNADIGKAIALGRALGVDIPKEFTDAPKPAEPVVGTRVKCGGRAYYTAKNGVHRVVGYDGGCTDNPGGLLVDAPNRGRNDNLTWVDASWTEILEDTDAVYE